MFKGVEKKKKQIQKAHPTAKHLNEVSSKHLFVAL